MAEDWSTREICLARIITKFEVCRGFRITASGKLVQFNNLIGTESDPITKALFNLISQTLTPIVNYMRQLLNQDSGNDPEYMIPYFLDHYTLDTADEFELTWAKIITAWDQADLVGWGRTILAIDQMRMEIFHHPLTKFGDLPIFQ